MTRFSTFGAAACAAVALTTPSVLAQSMAQGEGQYVVSQPLFTVGESFDDYAPPGVLDGMGAYQLDENTVRVLVNHELLNFRGYPYMIPDGQGGSFSLTGARLSYFDIDRTTRQVVAVGPAIDAVYDALGNRATDLSFLANDFAGFSRFCSSAVVEAHQFGEGGIGIEDRIYFTGEEDGGGFNPVGGAEWALDPETLALWHIPAMGRGAWENICEVSTGNSDYVAFLLGDDTSPYDANPDANDGDEAAPLYLYVGQKDPNGDFLARNGLRGGTLYVWVSDTGETSPLDWNTAGTRSGTWVVIDNAPDGTPSEDGSTGYDEWGYPTQRTLWVEARGLGAFGFSRPEDLATNPFDGTEAVLASTGVDTYAVDSKTGNGADTFGTLYLVDCDFTNIAAPTADITIMYDGDADLTRALRSPDNLDWADDGYIYVQEDKAETDTLSGDEVLFGDGATNPNEASIVRVNPADGAVSRVAHINRSVVLDASIANPTDAVDNDVDVVGAWESSGIIDVSNLFDEAPGTLFLFNVQAHGIDDQEDHNPDSRISDGDLVEGGQLLFVTFCGSDINGSGVVDVDDLLGVLSSWGSCSGCSGDIDGSGEVDVNDILLLLSHWGECSH